jgi:hypothetical protein
MSQIYYSNLEMRYLLILLLIFPSASYAIRSTKDKDLIVFENFEWRKKEILASGETQGLILPCEHHFKIGDI